MAYRVGGGAAIARTAEDDWVGPVSAPPLVPKLARNSIESLQPSRHPHPRCIEIDCVRHLIPPAILKIAAQRAIEADVGADRVLITWGILNEDTYVAALAASLNMAFEPLSRMPRRRCPLPDHQLVDAMKTGLLPLFSDDGLRFVVVPRLVDSRRLIALATAGGDLAWRLCLTSTAQLREFVTTHAARDIAHRAVNELQQRHPDLSAMGGLSPLLLFLTGALATTGAAIVAPHATIMTVELVFGAIFLAWTGLRMLGLLSERYIRRRPRPLTDDRLPVYTIAVALYREAAAVPGLVQALRELHYPLEKLDIKFVLEPDDRETRDAIDRMQLGPPFEIIVAPPEGPRTKPKALNAALPFARGSFMTVFDAEDRPEPDQLRLALDAFAAGDERLACVQARLTIDNTADSWLTRLFTAEYAGLFDVFLPGIAAWRFPLPLGGSSNHFRTPVLRRIGAWDPYNVTEDADLGMRLARFGYRTGVISSTTYEEAPARFGPWLRQRTRWFKGWMQTWLVHMRSPLKLADELGMPGFVVFQLVVGGTVLASLIHVLFAMLLVFRIANSAPDDPAARMALGLYTAVLMSGYAVSGVLAFVGLFRRGLLRYSWALLLMPVYWLLLSLAAWRALLQLLFSPYRWEKTEHGLARTSRLAGGPSQR